MGERYGDWALVTGGHSGIGFALSEQIAAEGVNLVIAARTQKALDEAAAKITAKHNVQVRTAAFSYKEGVHVLSRFDERVDTPSVQVRTVAADLSSKEGIEALIKAVCDIEIAVLVPNAGVEMSGFFAQAKPSSIEYALARPRA